MKIIVMINLCLVWAISSNAADMMELKNGVVFNHKLHQSSRVGLCSACHDNVAVDQDGKSVSKSEPGKIKGFGKEWAHKNCKDCHDTFGDGPVDCKGCHQKK